MRVLQELVIALVVGTLIGISAPGCNTFRGMGRDIQRGGEAVENAAEDAQTEIQRPNTITATAGSGGSIRPSGNTSMSYRSSRTFTIRANRGYHVADVLVDGKSVGARTRYTFDDVTENHTIAALFAANPSR